MRSDQPSMEPEAQIQPQDLVITMCGSYLRRPGASVWSGGMVELLAEFGFSTDAARAALSRLVSRGLLARVKVGRMVFYTLTRRAQELLAGGDRRIFSFGRGAPAADAWTVVWHAVPEDRRVERSRLASGLRFNGFGSVQDATWVAASDREQEVRALLASLELEAYAVVFVGRLARGSEPAVLLSNAWDVEEIGRVYAAFVATYGPYASGELPVDDREAFVVRTRMMHAFRGFPLQDPELPDWMMGGGGSRAAVVETFDAVYARLAAPAEAHFAAVTQVESREGSAA
jgi:phenylacetic acid degradation operon negative regulatory protein